MDSKCKIKNPVLIDCGTVVNGIHQMAIANWSDDYTATASGSDCMVDTIDLGTEKFYQVEVAKDSASANCESSIGANKDARALNHIVNGTFNKISCDLISDYKNFLLGTIIIAFQTRDRKVYIAGWENGLMAETFNFQTGAAEGDEGGITFSYAGIQPDFFLPVKDWATIKALM